MTVEVIKLKTICHYWLCSEVCSENYSVGGSFFWAEKNLWQRELANPKPSNAHQPPPPATALCGLKPAIHCASASSGMRILPTIDISTVSNSFYIQPHGAGNKHFSVKQTIFFVLLLLVFILLRSPASTRIFGTVALSPLIFPEIQVFQGSAETF